MKEMELLRIQISQTLNLNIVKTNLHLRIQACYAALAELALTIIVLYFVRITIFTSLMSVVVAGGDGSSTGQ